MWKKIENVEITLYMRGRYTRRGEMNDEKNKAENRRKEEA